MYVFPPRKETRKRIKVEFEDYIKYKYLLEWKEDSKRAADDCRLDNPRNVQEPVERVVPRMFIVSRDRQDVVI